MPKCQEKSSLDLDLSKSRSNPPVHYYIYQSAMAGATTEFDFVSFLKSAHSAVTKQISTEEVDVVVELVGHLLFFSGIRADGPKLVGRVEAL